MIVKRNIYCIYTNLKYDTKLLVNFLEFKQVFSFLITNKIIIFLTI